MLCQVPAHFPDEFTRRIRARLKSVGDLAAGRIANAQLIFIDIGVVNTIDSETAQHVIIHVDLAFVMLEAEGFEEILIDNDRPGGNDRVNHIVANEVNDHVF